MAGELEAVVNELEAVDREIQELEQNLEHARQRKRDLEKQRSEIEQRARENASKSRAPAAGDDPPAETPEQLQARIAELQKQIELQKKMAASNSQSFRSRSESPGKRSMRNVRAGDPTRARSSVKRRPDAATNPPTATTAVSAASASAPSEAAPSPTEGEKKKTWGAFGRGGRKKEDPSPAAAREEPEAPAPAPIVPVRCDPPAARPAVPPNSNEPPPSPMPGQRVKSVWERPGWATNMDIQDDRAVLSDPIKEGALKEQTTGYSRKVFDKDLDIQKGKFVKPSNKKVEARLTWVVLRINNTGVPGKVVMHLYGKDVPNLVDQFVELKDKTVVVGGPNKSSLTVQSEPPLHITMTGAQGLDTKDGVYGVVQEGKDIVDKVVSATGATLSIKQAHIFPVKVSKRGG